MGGAQTGMAAAIALVIGIFAGSALWWLALSFVIGMFRDRIHVSVYRWINQISGVILTIFGLVAMIGLLLVGVAFCAAGAGEYDLAHRQR